LSIECNQKLNNIFTIFSLSGKKTWYASAGKSIEENVMVYQGHLVYNRHNERINIRVDEFSSDAIKHQLERLDEIVSEDNITQCAVVTGYWQ